MRRVKIHAHELRAGDVLIGVLTGRPWRRVRSVEPVEDYDADPDGRAVNVDAVPLDAVGEFYAPIVLGSGVTVEVER